MPVKGLLEGIYFLYIYNALRCIVSVYFFARLISIGLLLQFAAGISSSFADGLFRGYEDRLVEISPHERILCNQYQASNRDFQEFRAEPISGVNLPVFLNDAEKIRAGHDASSLSSEELAAISAYSSMAYETINFSLRYLASGEMKLSEFRIPGWIKTLCSGLNKLPSYEGIVYRGTFIPETALKLYVPGNDVVVHGFMSSSMSLKIAKKFAANSAILKIHSKHGRIIGKYAMFPSEDEVLLATHSVFKVISVQQQGPITIVELDELF